MTLDNFILYTNTIKDNELFHFLKGTLQDRDALLEVATEFSNSPHRRAMFNPDDNCINDIYFTEEVWNEFYIITIKRDFLIKPLGNLDDRPLYNMMKTLVEYVQQEWGADPGKAYNKVVQLLQLVTKNQTEVIKFLELSLQTIIRSVYHKKSKNTRQISATAASITLGTSLIEFHFLQDRLIPEVLKFLTDKSSPNKLTGKKAEQVDKIFMSIIKEDYEYLSEYYKTKDKFVINVINNYVLSKTYNDAQKELTSFFIGETDLLETPSTKEAYLKACINSSKFITTYALKLGFQLFTIFCARGVFRMTTLSLNSKGKESRKTQYVFEIESKYEPELMSGFNPDKPYLHSTNNLFLQKCMKGDAYIYFVYKHKSQRIHHNADMKIQLSETCYLDKRPPSFKFTVSLFDLHAFLEYYKNIIVKYKSTKDIQDLKYFLTIYDIKLSTWLPDLETEDVFATVLLKILEFAMDFNNISLTEMHKDINKVGEDRRKRLVDLFNKVFQTKIYIIGLIRDATYYACFKYFIQDGFVDSRLRYYHNSIFTNINNFPFAKTFIKFYCDQPPLSKVSFRAVKLQVSKVLRFDNTIATMSYQDYNKQDKDLRYKYIYAFLNTNKISYEEFTRVLVDTTMTYITLLDFVYSYIKKINRTFIVLSLFAYEKGFIKNPSFKNYFELDATTSGFQMISILFNSISLGKMSNLIGDEKVDAYVAGCLSAQTNIKDFKEIKNSFILNYSPEYSDTIGTSKKVSIDEPEYAQLLDKPFSERLSAFLRMNLALSSYAVFLVNKLGEDFLQAYKVLPEIPVEFLWVLSPNEKLFAELHTHTHPSSFCKYLLLIKNVLITLDIVEKYNWSKVLQDRELFKKPIMTFFYNATSYGRKEDFLLLLKKHTPEVTIPHQNYFANMLEKFFMHFIATQIPDSQLMLKLSQILAKNKEKIYIKNKYCTIIFRPTKTKKFKVQTRTVNRKRGVQLSIHVDTKEISGAYIKQKFNANYIHSMDAFIVHSFYERLITLQSLLNKHFISISFSTNHDNFTLSFPPFLHHIVKDCYFELIDSNYLNSLSSNTSIFESIKALRHDLKTNPFKRINDHFIK